MTDKQKRTIKFIEQMLEIKYEGTSDLDASKFIGENLEYAQKCAYFESQMSMPVFSATFGLGRDEPNLDLKRELSRELLQRDLQRGKSHVESMANFSENLFKENIGGKND